MARIESLNILLDSTGKEYLAEKYGQVIQNVQKSTISSALKNTNLSGNPTSGTVEAKRLAFAKSKDYGTARTAGKGDAIKAKPVTVAINQDKELVEEVEVKDTTLYGVEGLIEKRTTEHQMAMIRELETAFFAEAGSVATVVTPTATDPLDVLEALILQVETTKNDYVNGVPRNMISVIMQPAEYSKIRNKINVDVKNANVDSSIEEFGKINGVTVYSSIDLPADVAMIAMCTGAVAQPVLPKEYTAEKINLANAYALELFFSYGTKAVMPDLIAKIAAA
jgi:hypothetical protein